MSHPSSTFLLMKANDPGLDEIWKDFYATLPKKSADPERAALQRQLKKERESLIHFAWFYNQVASSGTRTPVNDLAKRLNWPVDDVAQLVAKCLELRLLCKAKPGTYRCELSVMAVKMIGRMGVGRDDSAL